MKKFVQLNLALIAALICGCQSTIPANQKYESGSWGHVTTGSSSGAHVFRAGTSTSTAPREKAFVRRVDARLHAVLCLLSATQNGIAPNTQIAIHIPGNVLGTTLRYEVRADAKNRYLIQGGKQRVIDPVSNTVEHYKDLCQKEINKDIDAAIGISSGN